MLYQDGGGERAVFPPRGVQTAAEDCPSSGSAEQAARAGRAVRPRPRGGETTAAWWVQPVRDSWRGSILHSMMAEYAEPRAGAIGPQQLLRAERQRWTERSVPSQRQLSGRLLRSP